MMNINSIKRIYFIGIGGIGMSALARYFLHRKIYVAGFDKTATPLVELLVSEGAVVHFEEAPDQLDDSYDAVVYTPAIPQDNKELQQAKKLGLPLLKRAEMLQHIVNSGFTIAVAGSHGKTTVSSMVAHILKHSGYDCTAFLGGIALNYNSNFIPGDNDVFVVEADEFDRSFLKLTPNMAVITAIDSDHLDVYGTLQELERTFFEFANQVQDGGCLVAKAGLVINENYEKAKLIQYSADEVEGLEAKAYAISVENKVQRFNFSDKNGVIEAIKLSYPGRHNVENFTAAITIARQLGITADKIRDAVSSFCGIKRRFQYIVKQENCVYIDDYAHHPTEIRALINSIKQLFPGHRITAAFQPHLFTRTRDFAAAFAESISLADEVIILPIYPARELPIEGVTADLILDKVTVTNKSGLDKVEFVEYVQLNRPELLVTIGAGDIDQLVEPLKKILNG